MEFVYRRGYWLRRWLRKWRRKSALRHDRLYISHSDFYKSIINYIGIYKRKYVRILRTTIDYMYILIRIYTIDMDIIYDIIIKSLILTIHIIGIKKPNRLSLLITTLSTYICMSVELDNRIKLTSLYILRDHNITIMKLLKNIDIYKYRKFINARLLAILFDIEFNIYKFYRIYRVDKLVIDK
jgi:hypothetical protein